jgi:hypothetical protein
MIFSASTWSEVPLSTSKQQALNGDVVAYQLYIDQILPLDVKK